MGYAQNFQGLLGLMAILFICWSLSENRGRFPWRLAVGTIVVQAILMVALFGLPPLRTGLLMLGHAVDGLATATQVGVAFVFGFLSGTGPQPYSVNDPGALFVFAFRVLPVILVVCALSALLWHWKILKWLTRAFGFIFERGVGLPGPPALACGATIFMGQVEGAIFIRGYLSKLSRADLFLVMTMGMACVSGSTMVAYATILKGVLPNAAAHVLAASLLSAPAGLLLARTLIPADKAVAIEPEENLPSERVYDSSIDAVIRGTQDGLQLTLNIGAALVVFVALFALANQLLGVFGEVAGEPLSLERIAGTALTPLAWLIGISWQDAPAAGSLLGVKLFLTEFTSFIRLGEIPPESIDARTRILLTYALCGFANIGSVGINLAGFSLLVPERRGEVGGMVWKAMLAGFLATCLTASVVGLLPVSLMGVQ